MPLGLELLIPVRDDGTLPPGFGALIRDKLREFAGGEVMLSITGPRRSTKANGYYWGCVIAPIQYGWHLMGKDYTGTALHNHFKDLYLAVIAQELLHDHGLVVEYEVEDPRPDGKADRYLTTTRLCPTSFYRYVEAVKEDAAVKALMEAFKLRFEPVPKVRSGRIDEPLPA